MRHASPADLTTAVPARARRGVTWWLTHRPSARCWGRVLVRRRRHGRDEHEEAARPARPPATSSAAAASAPTTSSSCCRPGTDPLGPDNPLIFAVRALCRARPRPVRRAAAVVTKSPQTGLYLFCITGGDLGPAIKRSGYDVIVLTGRSEKPVYVEVAGGRAKLHDAAHLWGLDTQSTQEFIRDELPARRAGHHLHRPGRRAPGPVRLPAQRAPRPRSRRRRGGHGLQEREGAGRARRRRGCRRWPIQPAFKAAVRNATAELRANPFTSGPLKMYGSVSTVAVTLNSGIMPADNWQRSATTAEAGRPSGRRPCATSIWSRTRPAAIPARRAAPRSPSCARARTPAPRAKGPNTRPSIRSGTSCGIYDLGAVIAGRPDLRPARASTPSRSA